MNQQEFDDKIKASLEAIQVPYDPDSWAALEKKMDMSMDQSVAGFDTTVRNALDRVEVPYDAELWNVMSRQLDQTAAIRKVRFVKLAEAAVILLLALQIVSTPSPDSVPSQPLDPQQPPSAPTSTPMAVRKAPDSGFPGPDLVVLPALHRTPVALLPDASIPVTSSREAVESVSWRSDNPVLVSTLTPSILTIQRAAPGLSSIPTKILPEKTSGKWFIAAAAEAGASVIRNDQPASYSGLAPGFGISVGKDSGKWGFETGIQVSRTSFTPDSRTTVYAGTPQTGFLAYYTTGADATVVSIPLRVSRKVAGNSALELRALAGIAAELVAEKNYSRRTVFLPPAGQSTGGSNLPAGTIPDKIQNGLLEGGKISNNLTTSAQFGLRLKARVGSTYSIFVEPVASLHLAGGWGPDKDKIDRYSVRAGVYARL